MINRGSHGCEFKYITHQWIEAVAVCATERFIYVNHEYIVGRRRDGVYGSFAYDHTVRGDPGRVQYRCRGSKPYFPGFQVHPLDRFPDINIFLEVEHSVEIKISEKELARSIFCQVPDLEFGRIAVGRRVDQAVKEANFIVRRVKGAIRILSFNGE